MLQTSLYRLHPLPQELPAPPPQQELPAPPPELPVPSPQERLVLYGPLCHLIRLFGRLHPALPLPPPTEPPGLPVAHLRPPESLMWRVTWASARPGASQGVSHPCWKRRRKMCVLEREKTNIFKHIN